MLNKETLRQISTGKEDRLSSETWRPTNVDIITISGHPGTGKTVTGQMVAEVLDMEYIKIGDLFRTFIRETRGQEVVGYIPREEDMDKMLDDKQRILMESARIDGRKILLEGRLAGVIATEEQISAREGHYPISRIQRVLFTADQDERVKRIRRRYPDLALNQILHLTTEREQKDLATWRNLHPSLEDVVDLYDPELKNASGLPRFADIIVDTTHKSKEAVAEDILFQLADIHAIESVTPPRLPHEEDIFINQDYSSDR